MKINLFEIPGDKNNDSARETLGKLEGIAVTHFICPPSLGEFYVVPYIRAEPGGSFFGVDSIRDFVDRTLKGG